MNQPAPRMGMPQPRPVAVAPQGSRPTPVATRPRLFDYLILFLGIGVSALLADVGGLRAIPSEIDVSAFVASFARNLPFLLFLPLGIVLCWPVFYFNQKLLGRQRELTSGEWLLGLAWLVGLAYSIWLLWRGLGTLPEFMSSTDFKNSILMGYVIFTASMGGLAFLLYVIGLIGRWVLPWTHTFGLALLIWPLVPLGLWWLSGMKLE
ncbi:MAG: hypothetical protein L0Y72_10835 [Gemmataceae bacterium]|nr:hypothetical protein [Gemmataceae bacterium]MCI0739530.1 hypothetical protein [Gemmataceae bacterium]